VKIWKCPDCNAGVRAPEQLKRLDVRRWCLRCSARTGSLVERTVPSKQTEATRRAAARVVATAKRQEQRAVSEAAAKDFTVQLASSFDRPRELAAAWLRAWAPRCIALRTLRDHHKDNYPGKRWKPAIQIRQGGGKRERLSPEQVHAWHQEHRGGWSYDPKDGSGLVTVSTGRQSASGHAWPWSHRLCVTTGAAAADDLSTLIHELAHLAAPKEEHHGPVFQLVQRDAVEELTGESIVDWHRNGAQCRVEVIQRWLDKQKVAP
jgi:hypothetical protein